jgi:predicted PurR-regulated permease PerM
MAASAPIPASTPQSRLGLLVQFPLLLLALVVLGLYLARDVLIPLAMGLSVNFLLTPAVMQLERLRIRRVPAVLLVAVMGFSLAGGVGWIVARQVIAVINDLPNYRENIHDKLASLHAPTGGGLGLTVKSIREIGAEISNETEPKPVKVPRTWREREQARLEAEKEPVPVRVVPPTPTRGEYLREYAVPVLKPIGALSLVLIFSFYMMVKREDLRNRLLLLAGRGRLNLMTQALNEAAGRISQYLITNVLVNAGYGVLFGVGLYLLHVPNATLWGALMGILRMIPYAGTMLAGFSTIAFTLAVFDNWWHPLWVLLLFGGLEFVVANFAEPHIYGKRTGISPFALIVMAIVWTLLWGWPGLIVSTPMTVCLIVMGRYVPQMSFLYILMGEDAELSPEAHYYERLLAMDESESRRVVDEFLKEHTLAELYDRVVLPALSLSEQDRHKGAMDEVHSAWLYQTTTELVAEHADYKDTEPAEAAAQAEATAMEAATPEETPEATEDERESEAAASPVICVPVADQADEIAATMLAQLLERSGHGTMLLTPSAMSEELMERLAEAPETIVCISAMPPFAFAQARKLAQSLRKGLPKNRMVVGLWGSKDSINTLRERFGAARPNAIATTLGDALERVRELEGGAGEKADEGVPAVPALMK